MKYILNSAVITSPGTYTYELISIEEAKRWVVSETWESTIRYKETANALSKITGVPVPVMNITINMKEGDEALVFRLVFPRGYRPDPSRKGDLGEDFIVKHCETGILKRIE